MSIQNWEHFFKPEVRSSGQSLVKQGKTSVSQPSDTEIVIYVRISPPLKVVFKATSVESPSFTVSCSCPAGKDGRFCKHIWAGLLATEKDNSDFFESKTKIEMKDLEEIEKKTPSSQATEREAAFKEKQEVFKEKQNAYRKEQYQKQKARQKEFKNKKKNLPEESSYPLDVDAALQFFAKNGFELKESMNLESVGIAKKKLARIFHPDLGGSHSEIIELNHHSEILANFIERQ